MSESLLEVLKKRRDYALLKLVKGQTEQKRPGALVSVFLEAVSHHDDERTVELVPLILQAIDEARDSTQPTDEEMAALKHCEHDWQRDKVREDYGRDARVNQLIDLFLSLPAEGEHSLLIKIKTKRALVMGILEAWASAHSDERAYSYLERLFCYSLCSPVNSQVSYHYRNLLAEVFREVTGKDIPIIRLDRVINILSGDERQVLRDFPILCGEREGREEVLRVLLIARARNVKLGRVGQEIPVLSSLEGSSTAAYVALLDEAKKIAAQDVAGQELLVFVKKRDSTVFYDDKAITGDISLEFPDRSTIVVKILWDENRDLRVKCPEDDVLHRWTEMARERAASWLKEYNSGRSPAVRVTIRLFTSKKVWGNEQRKEVLFREQKVSEI